MKRKLVSRLIIISLIVAMVLGGCGNSGDSTNQETGSEDNNDSGSKDDSEGGEDETVTLKFTYWGSGDEKKAIEESVDMFMEENPNIKVNLMHIPSEDFLTKLNAMIAARETPDISYS